MIVNLNKPLTDFDGKPVTSGEGPIMLSNLVVQALLAATENERNETPQKKLERWELARKVHNASKTGSDVELSAEEIVLIKTRGAEVLSAPAFGPVAEAIEGKTA